jgi:hypothetical protein
MHDSAGPISSALTYFACAAYSGTAARREAARPARSAGAITHMQPASMSSGTHTTCLRHCAVMRQLYHQIYHWAQGGMMGGQNTGGGMGGGMGGSNTGYNQVRD